MTDFVKEKTSVAGMFEGYIKACFRNSENMPPEVKKELEKAFYSGFTAMFGVFRGIVFDDDNRNEESAKYMEALENEIDAYINNEALNLILSILKRREESRKEQNETDQTKH